MKRTLLILCLLAVPAFGQRQMDNLGRGVIAQRTGSGSTYVSWRMLGSDDDDIAFDLYRTTNGGGDTLIASGLTATTDYQDSPGSSALNGNAIGYYVVPVVGGVPGSPSAPWELPVNAGVEPFFEFSFTADPGPDGPYDTKFAWVGDFNNDGEYDFLCDRLSTLGANEQFLEAYLRDGTFLWRMHMGPNSLDQYNIEPGSSAISIGHGDNVTCYDLQGDGIAEAIVRTSNGVTITDSGGSTIGSITHGNNDDQFLTVVNGATGAIIDSAPVPNNWPQHGPMNHKCFIAYLDGKNPSIVLFGNNRNGGAEFYYQWTAWDLVGGSLVQRWTWAQDQSVEPGAEGHQIRIADVDNDGRDEIVDIGHVVDDDGNQLYVIDVTHGDRFHVADIHPLRPGLETFLIQQNNPGYLATAYVNAEDGSFYKKWYAAANVDVGRGLTVDMDPNYLGMEMFSTQPGIFNAEGTQTFANSFFPYEGLWWDNDTGREFIIGTNGPGTSPAVNKFNPGTGGQNRLYINGNNIYDYSVRQSYGGRPAFWGDILGDWREELVLTKSDYSGIRVLSTNTPADDRRRTLMHNAQYRVQTTTKGYVQGSYVDYYLGFETSEDPPPPIADTDHTWVAGPTFNATTCPPGESILFDLSGDSSLPIALTGALTPSRVKVFSPIDYEFDGTLGSLGGTMDFLKSGEGTLTITGTHAYTGWTQVWDGALNIDGTLSATPVTVHGGTWGGPLAEGNTGGRLGGSGTVSQPVTLAWRGAIAPGDGNGDAATLTLGGGLTCEDDTVLSLDLSNVSTSDQIAITGNLTLNGTTTLTIHALEGSLNPGTHTLITYTGSFSGSLNDFEVRAPLGTPYSLSDTGSAIQITVPSTRAADAITWDGGLNGNTWDLFNTQNFSTGGGSTEFVSGDTVTFDNSGSPHTTITLDGDLAPASVTVDSTLDYTFTGSGSLVGTGGVTKSGTGTLTVGDGHTFTGPVTINEGTVAINSLADAGMPSSLGAGSTAPTNLVLNGGAIRHDGFGTATNRGMRLESGGGTINLPGESLQLGGSVEGPGALTKEGPGLLLIGGGNSYSGGTFIDDGTIQLASDTATASGLGSGTITFRGGTLSMTDNSSSYNSASYDLVVPTGETGRLNADSRVYLGGTLTGAGDFTLYSPFVRTDLQGDWSAFTGTLFVIADGDGGDFRVDNTNGYDGATVDLGPDVWAYYMPNIGSNLTLDLGALSGHADANLQGAGSSSSGTFTWRIGGNDADTTYAGATGERGGSTTTAIRKIGTGIQTFTGSLAHRGDTIVDGGTLRLEGTSSDSDFVVNNGGTLGGTGSITGDLDLNNGSALELAATPLAITGNITGSGTITITPLSPTTPGSYVVATYTGSFSGSPTFAWGGPGTASFSTAGNQISVTVSDPATKVHHYTFNDGTFTDLVGTLDGTTAGAASLTGGSLVLTGGTGELNATTLAINTYPSVSIEFWATADDAANTGYHALFGLGEENPVNNNLASNYILLTTHRGDDQIRGAIATNNQDADPFTEEDSVNTGEINDASEHHYVLTISGAQLALYVDGSLVDTQATTQSLANVATEIASIGSLYPADNNWEGSVNEFALYSGTLTPAEVSAAYAAGPVPNPSDSDGDLMPDAWELTYYASVGDAGPLDDTDGDGLNTWEEWKAGTDPTNNAEYPGNLVPGTVSLAPVADAPVFHRDGGYAYNSTNYGTAEQLDTSQYGGGIWAMSYIRFDLSSIPAGATIDAATFSVEKQVTANIAGFAVVRNDTINGGRFGSYGLLDVAGNTSQSWDEGTITGDSLGSELVSGTNPQIDTTTRAIDFNTDTETITGGTLVEVTGTNLTTFLQGRFDATGHATVIIDFMDDAGSGGRGYSFASRENTGGLQPPTLDIDYTAGTPLPDTDEDNDNLEDAWEAHYLSTLTWAGSDDPDGDGFDNEAEETAGSDPDNIASTPLDTDADGLADSWELANFGDLDETGTGDPDGDGFNNEAEETAGSDPDNIASTPLDTDADGLADSWELANFGDLDETGTGDPDGDGFDNEAEETAGTDPDDALFTPDDTDGDTLADAWETTHFSNLAKGPGDDTDGDNTPEWLEEALGLGPNDPHEAFTLTIAGTGPGSFQLTWSNTAEANFTVECFNRSTQQWEVEETIPGSTSPATLSHPLTSGGAANLHRVRATPK